jgi:hypothetical protein
MPPVEWNRLALGSTYTDIIHRAKYKHKTRSQMGEISRYVNTKNVKYQNEKRNKNITSKNTGTSDTPVTLVFNGMCKTRD